jgi:alkyldihydroxyacetonephosphate synthase
VSVRVDHESLLADVGAEETLASVEATLGALGLTLGLERDAWPAVSSLPVGRWLAEGAKGTRDPWLDPADHLLAGFEAHLHDGRGYVMRPSPRRATGPDLAALIVGMRERYARLDRAWLRVHTISVLRPKTAPFHAERDPAPTEEEARLFAAIGRELEVP